MWEKIGAFCVPVGTQCINISQGTKWRNERPNWENWQRRSEDPVFWFGYCGHISTFLSVLPKFNPRQYAKARPYDFPEKLKQIRPNINSYNWPYWCSQKILLTAVTRRWWSIMPRWRSISKTPEITEFWSKNFFQAFVLQKLAIYLKINRELLWLFTY